MNDAQCNEYIVHEATVSKVRLNMPESETFQKVSEYFKALGDETRAKMLWALNQSEMCVCDLAETLGMTSSAISHQLASLRKVNLVKYRRAGKVVFYSISDDHVRSMLESAVEHTQED